MKKKINSYIDSTYLKTADEAELTELENKKIVFSVIEEAMLARFACVMIRPIFVLDAVQKIRLDLKVGTVIDFPLGGSDTIKKIDEAKYVIQNGAHDIDFVSDYNAFKRGDLEKFNRDILEGTKLCLDNKRIVKWIIETGALSKDEIRRISKHISNLIETNFSKSLDSIFIKTSTGYYGGFGATVKDIKLIK